MIRLMTSFAVLFGACLVYPAATPAEQNLFAMSSPGRIVLVTPERPAAVEEFAIAELDKHLAEVIGTRLKVRPAVDGLWMYYSAADKDETYRVSLARER